MSSLRPSFAPKDMNPRTVLGALAVGALLVAFLVWRDHVDAIGATLASLFGTVALFLRVEKGQKSEPRIPRDTQPGIRGSWTTGGSSGGNLTAEEADAARAKRMKRDLLTAWAKAGETIDGVTELKAQLVIDEIEERGARWLKPGERSDPPPVDDDDPTAH